MVNKMDKEKMNKEKIGKEVYQYILIYGVKGLITLLKVIWDALDYMMECESANEATVKELIKFCPKCGRRL